MLNFRSPRLWEHFKAYGLGFVGFGLGHTLVPFRDPMLDTALALVGVAAWGIGIAGVKHTDKPAPELPEPGPVVMPRSVPNLNESDKANGWVDLRERVYPQTVKHEVLNVLDPRIKQWAWAVTYENTAMTQQKWCGRKKLFSKPLYVAFIAELLKEQYVTVIDAKDPKSSYKPNGRRGREYIRDLAIGRAFRPLPTRLLTERDTHFLRERMRRRTTEGEGGS
jgi:hypothetical protein